MKPLRDPRYLAWIRTLPCVVCGSTRRIEASHTGPTGSGRSRPIPRRFRCATGIIEPEATATTDSATGNSQKSITSTFRRLLPLEYQAGHPRRSRRFCRLPRTAAVSAGTDRGGNPAGGETRAVALKETLAWQVQQAMEKDKISKVEMARRMNTSRAALDRLLDPGNASVTLQTLRRAAHTVGRDLRIELV